LIFSKQMTTDLLPARYLYEIIEGEDCHGEKAIEQGGKEAGACGSYAAKGQGLRASCASRWGDAADRVRVKGSVG
jgi:hypothetical protein